MERIEKIKDFKTKLADIDEKTDTVAVYYSTFNTPDRTKEIVMPSAFTKSIKERGPKGENEIWHLFNHNKNMPVTKPRELYTDNYGLKSVFTLPDTTLGRDTREMYKSGLITHHSFGYYEINTKQNGEFTELNELYLTEGSHVLWPAHFGSKTQKVNLKSFDNEELPDLLVKMDEFIHKSSATDEAIKNIELLLKQLIETITQPKNITVPGVEVANTIKSFKITL